MCWTILAAFVIVFMLVIWAATGVQNKNEVLEDDVYRLKMKLRDCQDERAMESVRLKSSEYRADKRGGFDIEES